MHRLQVLTHARAPTGGQAHTHIHWPFAFVSPHRAMPSAGAAQIPRILFSFGWLMFEQNPLLPVSFPKSRRNIAHRGKDAMLVSPLLSVSLDRHHHRHVRRPVHSDRSSEQQKAWQRTRFPFFSLLLMLLLLLLFFFFFFSFFFFVTLSRSR